MPTPFIFVNPTTNGPKVKNPKISRKLVLNLAGLMFGQLVAHDIGSRLAAQPTGKPSKQKILLSL